MDDKREIKIKKSEQASKLENFWFYYKWHVIISVLVVFVIIVCTAQACSREKEDMSIVYAGSAHIGAESYAEIKGLFSSILPEDFDKDGKKNVGLVSYQIYSEAEIEELQNTILPDGTRPRVDTAQNTTNYNNLTTYRMTGQSNIYFLSAEIYNNFLVHGQVKPLSEIFGDENVPEITKDGYCVRLGDTDFYKYNSSIQVFGEDTVICMLAKTVHTKEEQYQNEIEMFKTILNYEINE